MAADEQPLARWLVGRIDYVRCKPLHHICLISPSTHQNTVFAPTRVLVQPVDLWLQDGTLVASPFRIHAIAMRSAAVKPAKQLVATQTSQLRLPTSFRCDLVASHGIHRY